MYEVIHKNENPPSLQTTRLAESF